MRVKSIRLRDYKRFTDLTISGLPATARLVVLVGPNGTGKSSVFDSFLLKVRAAYSNEHIQGPTEEYYDRQYQSRYTHQVADRVHLEFHGTADGQMDWKSAFVVRSAYRNQSDFRIQTLQTPTPDAAATRIVRIIDPDESVSRNYERLVWQGVQDTFRGAPGHTTFDEYRKTSLGDLQCAMRKLFSDPAVSLQDLGGIETGSFRFSKGATANFHYKNLSGGEKAAFDLLLDVFVKRDQHRDAVFCIDEPELHVAVPLQGRLIAAVSGLLRSESQLWVATHSIGVMREAYKRMQRHPDEVVFLDFSERDFDGPVRMTPSVPNRTFWMNMYEVTLDDLSSLVAPDRVVICEGSMAKHRKGFDAQCYNRLFADEVPSTLFVSGGGSGEVIRSKHLGAILQEVARGIEIQKLIDRDDMTDDKRSERIKTGTRVLRRREIEDYLYDPDVLRTFLETNGCADVVEEVLGKLESLVGGQSGPKNINDLSQPLFETIRRATGLRNLGNKRREFALQFLVVALRKTPHVYEELRQDVFGEVATS